MEVMAPPSAPAPRPPTQGGTASRAAADRRLLELVERELERAPDVTESSVGVTVLGRAVTLTGEVASHPEKRSAERAALSVPGVRAMAGKITVRPHLGRVSDVDVTREVAAALVAAVEVPDQDVLGTVTDHVVTLSGTVRSVPEREAAVLAVHDLPGVAGVHDHVVVQPVD
ncbi:Osmotically-inducible protein Y [Nocardioides aquaticus]|uniref:Osmotically-inducible protein Y n=2 Tax=Nocardioides aquaticus TaxID=160826 RepID=A0ABX8EGZ6_9ACTN|nr:Osmotically-inducible protein Y [Nocardioides aquaticus]